MEKTTINHSQDNQWPNQGVKQGPKYKSGFKIWGCYDGDYEDYCFLACDAAEPDVY
jgi:hypothetical protein